MKATLEFSLPEEREEFNLAQSGVLYSLVLGQMDQYLRGKIKYEDLPEHEEKIYQDLRDQLHRFADEYEVKV